MLAFELAAVALLIVLNGFFAMAELALARREGGRRSPDPRVGPRAPDPLPCPSSSSPPSPS